MFTASIQTSTTVHGQTLTLTHGVNQVSWDEPQVQKSVNGYITSEFTEHAVEVQLGQSVNVEYYLRHSETDDVMGVCSFSVIANSLKLWPQTVLG